MEHHRHPERLLRHVLSLPFIYGLAIPLVAFDLCVEIYHRFCFPLYGIPYVHRSEYIRIDRFKLSYLSFQDRLNCAYCGYANGLMRYAARVAADTERYWCGIRQRSGGGFREQEHQAGFLPFGDADAYEKARIAAKNSGT